MELLRTRQARGGGSALPVASKSTGQPQMQGGEQEEGALASLDQQWSALAEASPLELCICMHSRAARA